MSAYTAKLAEDVKQFNLKVRFDIKEAKSIVNQLYAEVRRLEALEAIRNSTTVSDDAIGVEKIGVAIHHLKNALTNLEAERLEIGSQQYGRHLSITITNIETAKLWCTQTKLLKLNTQKM